MNSPHTSKREEDMDEYYVAEIQGETRNSCSKYSCEVSLLDFFSKVIYDTH